MKKEDRKQFKQVMQILNEVFGDPAKPMSDIKLDFYFKALEGLSIEKFNDAAVRLAQTKTYHVFPTPAELLEAALPKADPVLAATEAFLSLIAHVDHWKSVVFEDGIIGACVEALGGWNVVLDWREEDRKWNHKNFIDLYQRYYAQGRALPPVTYLGADEKSYALHSQFRDSTPTRTYVPASEAVRALPGFLPGDRAVLCLVPDCVEQGSEYERRLKEPTGGLRI